MTTFVTAIGSSSFSVSMKLLLSNRRSSSSVSRIRFCGKGWFSLFDLLCICNFLSFLCCRRFFNCSSWKRWFSRFSSEHNQSSSYKLSAMSSSRISNNQEGRPETSLCSSWFSCVPSRMKSSGSVETDFNQVSEPQRRLSVFPYIVIKLVMDTVPVGLSMIPIFPFFKISYKVCMYCSCTPYGLKGNLNFRSLNRGVWYIN